MPARDTAALHPLPQQRSRAVTALLVRVGEGGSHVADVAWTRLPRRQVQGAPLGTACACAERRYTLPMSGRQEVIDLFAASRTFPAREQAQPGPATGPFHWANRRLSVAEMARLQTFPRDVTITGDLSGGQRQLGNAVPSLLAEVLAREVRRQLLDRPSREKGLRLEILPAAETTPPPERVEPVPRRYLKLRGEHEAHPGTGRGYAASARRSSLVDVGSLKEIDQRAANVFGSAWLRTPKLPALPSPRLPARVSPLRRVLGSVRASETSIRGGCAVALPTGNRCADARSIREPLRSF